MLKVCIIKFKLYLYVHACNTFDSKTFHYALIKRYILFHIEIITGDWLFIELLTGIANSKETTFTQGTRIFLFVVESIVGNAETLMHYPKK